MDRCSLLLGSASTQLAILLAYRPAAVGPRSRGRAAIALLLGRRGVVFTLVAAAITGALVALAGGRLS